MIEIKLSIHGWHDSTYKETLKDSTKKLLALIHNSAKLQGTRSTHKNQLCVYTPTMNNHKKKLKKQL